MDLRVAGRFLGVMCTSMWLLLFVVVIALCSGEVLPLSEQLLAQQLAADAPLSHAGAKAAVQFLYPEQISIPAGKQSSVDLHFKIAAGLHINSHTPRGKTLISTNLVVVEQPGVNVLSVDFPPGKEYAFPFSPEEKLSVYSEDFILRARMRAEKGEHLLQAALRYQACDSNSCYPPKTIPVAIDVIAK